MCATALDHLRQSIGAELPDGCVARKSPGATRPLGIPVGLITGVRGVGNIRGAMRHGSAMCGRVGYEGVATVIRDIEPFMSIRRPGVRCIDTGQQMTVRGARRTP